MNKYYFGLILSLTLIFSACSHKEQDEEGFNIIGVWVLQKTIMPDGTESDYTNGNYTRCKVYDKDSIYYTVQIISNGEVFQILPHEKARYIQHDTLYIENNRETPFEIINDSVFTTFYRIYTEVWKKTEMSESRIQEIRDSFSSSEENKDISEFISGEAPTTQKMESSRLLILIIVLVATIIGGFVFLVFTLRGKRKAQRELQAILDDNANRTDDVNEKILQAENDFFGSDFYTTLHKRVVKGDTLRKSDWEDISAQLKEAFPKFESRLSSLCKMSDVEMQVCMLLKMRFTPSEIATVIIKDVSSISSIRSRLYQKVFGKKGGAKDWDEFLKTL